MGCNCKSDRKIDDILENGSISKEKIGKQIISYSLKTLGFLIVLALLPIINLFIIWFIFKTLVLNTSVDLKPLLSVIGKKFDTRNMNYDDDDDSDYDSLTEDDVIMVDVEDIKNTVNA